MLHVLALNLLNLQGPTRLDLRAPLGFATSMLTYLELETFIRAEGCSSSRLTHLVEETFIQPLVMILIIYFLRMTEITISAIVLI